MAGPPGVCGSAKYPSSAGTVSARAKNDHELRDRQLERIPTLIGKIEYD